MRQIKFRAWDKWHKRMTVGPYDGDFIKWHAPSNWQECYEVMQYTGLTDRNGKEIYEGDIEVGSSFKRPSSARSNRSIASRILEW